MSAASKLLERTGQLGKFRIGFAVVFIGGAFIFFAGFLIGKVSTAVFMAVSTLGLFVGFGGMIYLCNAIRCPTCHARWVWLLASKRREDPLHWSFNDAACPVCGHSGESGA